jgi:RNA polymerase sigma factor (sigma-70 family)
MSPVSDERAIWLGRHVLPHEPALRAWLSRRRLGGLDVDDIIQETYSRLMTAESVQHVHDARSYTFQVAGSAVIDHLRRMKVVSIASLPDFDYLEIVSDEPSPERQVIDRDELHRLAGMIARLPGRVREVFTLRRVYGLSQREVAEKLGISESTVEKHMARGFLVMLEQFRDGGNHAVYPSSLKSGNLRNPDARTDTRTDIRPDARKDRTSD